VDALAARAAEVRRGLADLAGARAAAAAAAAAGTNPAPPSHPGAPPLPTDVAGLAGELAALRGAQQYAAALQDLVALARHLDRHARAVERAVGGGGGGSSVGEGGSGAPAAPPASSAAVLDAAGEAVAAAAMAAAACEAAATLPSTGVPAALTAHAAAALARTRAATDRLTAALRAALGRAAAAAGWPPPFVSASGAAAGGPLPAWAGWEEHPASGDEACRLVAALVALQRAVTPGRFARAGVVAEGEEEEEEGAGPPTGAPPAAAPALLEGPPLWWAAELAAPLGARLAALFTPAGAPADAPDKPEWLFAAALRAATAAAAGAAPLQPGLDAHGLSAAYGAGFEAARAVRAALAEAVLAPHVLPRLAALAAPPLWLHFAAEAAAFERALAPVRGLTGGGGGAEAAPPGTPEPWPPGSCLALVCSHPAWRDGWWGAERDRAISEVDAALDAPGAWEPAASPGTRADEDALVAAGGWGGPGGGGDAPSTPSTRACQAEFWPPAAFPALLAALSGAASRVGWLDGRSTRRAYVAAVPRAVLAHTRGRWARDAAAAAEYRDLASPAWAPRVGALVCGARCLEHALREAAWPLVLLDEGTTASSSGSHPPPPHHHAHHPSVLAAEADAAGAFARKWALRLARAASDAFIAAAGPYRRAASVRGGAFLLPPGTPPPAGPSPALLPALHAFGAALDTLAGALDAVAFRDAWRAAAGGAVRFLFNDIATEGAFTPAGGAQFAADVAALGSVLGGVGGSEGATTARPGAHVREAAEAAALLAEADGGRVAAATAAAAAGAGGGGVEALRELGITRLTPEQVGAVLARRG